MIRQFHDRGEEGMVEVLTELEADEMLRWQVVDELREATSALEVVVPDGRFVIESAPIRDQRGQERGVVAEGPVGTNWAGRFRLFRYEIRRWRGGTIPDASEAVSSPVRVANDLGRAQRVLDLVPSIPTPVWGRDELHTGDMWNSNSLISWLLVRAGVDTDPLQPPPGGRAPGWDSGLFVARGGV